MSTPSGRKAATPTSEMSPLTPATPMTPMDTPSSFKPPPPVSSGKKVGMRRKSILDMKVDKGAVAAAAAENLKLLHLPSIGDDEDGSEGPDDINSVISFAQSQTASAVAPQSVATNKPFAGRSDPTRLSITAQRSSVGSGGRDSQSTAPRSQATVNMPPRPPPPPAGELPITAQGSASEYLLISLCVIQVAARRKPTRRSFSAQ
jgi:hypothetical protein